MRIRKYLLSLLVTGLAIAQAEAQTKSDFMDYFSNYKNPDAEIAKSTLKDVEVDDKEKTITIYTGGGFPEQHFTEETVRKIYDDLREIVPSKKKGYDIKVIADGLPIESLIPNSLRTKNKDRSRMWKKVYKGEPWVKNISRPEEFPLGLEGTHIALWQSHGRFYKTSKMEWVWQRPPLFCTVEDLFSQTFVIPYIIPMLENAGAVVFTPRERDWQKNEVIVDNDHPTKDGMYIEASRKKGNKLKWHTTDQYGFSHLKDVYYDGDSPFTDGTARYVPTTTSKKEETFAEWIPDIPEDGKYAVYVSYQTTEESVPDAHYIVYHKGGITEFKVNQKMGSGTWVYLGTFEFSKGENDFGMVVLSNMSGHKGVVTGDAVRFGGGMGNIARGMSRGNGIVSGMPRWAEAARYYEQWAGMPKEIYSFTDGENDYRDDINARSQMVNYLSGGSVYNPEQQGKKVPFEMSLAFHTDAGFSRTGDYIGTLSIFTTDFNDGKTGAGLDRYVSRDISSSLLTGLSKDMKKYGWKVRQLWNRNYSETREPMVPASILEMLSHQNFDDMRMAYDPHFKFDFCRSVYKTIVKNVAEQHGRDYVIQPLPIRNFSVEINERRHTATLSWAPTDDPTEPTAKAQEYILYTRTGYDGFDNGQIVKGTSCTVELVPDIVYSFKVTASNKGGESFPSEILSACVASKSEGKILIVNGFTRLSGPASIDTDDTQGFDLDADPGVPYGAFAGFCGRQIGFDKSKMGSERKDGLGYSGNELAGKIFMGNTFDYTFIHGRAIHLTGRFSFTSMSEDAFINRNMNLSEYRMIDMIYGVQKEFRTKTANILSDYCRKGGNLLVSGTFAMQDSGLGNIMGCRQNGNITEKSVKGVSGSGLNFSIYREMNEHSYAVPATGVLAPQNSNAFAMLAYSNGSPAGIAYNGNGYKSIALGFPLESIIEANSRNLLMGALINYLLGSK